MKSKSIPPSLPAVSCSAAGVSFSECLRQSPCVSSFSVPLAVSLSQAGLQASSYDNLLRPSFLSELNVTFLCSTVLPFRGAPFPKQLVFLSALFRHDVSCDPLPFFSVLHHVSSVLFRDAIHSNYFINVSIQKLSNSLKL